MNVLSILFSAVLFSSASTHARADSNLCPNWGKTDKGNINYCILNDGPVSCIISKHPDLGVSCRNTSSKPLKIPGGKKFTLVEDSFNSYAVFREVISSQVCYIATTGGTSKYDSSSMSCIPLP